MSDMPERIWAGYLTGSCEEKIWYENRGKYDWRVNEDQPEYIRLDAVVETLGKLADDLEMANTRHGDKVREVIRKLEGSSDER